MVHDNSKKFVLRYFGDIGSIQFELKRGIFTPFLREGQCGTLVHREFKFPLVGSLFYTVKLALKGALGRFFGFCSTIDGDVVREEGYLAAIFRIREVREHYVKEEWA